MWVGPEEYYVMPSAAKEDVRSRDHLHIFVFSSIFTTTPWSKVSVMSQSPILPPALRRLSTGSFSKLSDFRLDDHEPEVEEVDNNIKLSIDAKWVAFQVFGNKGNLPLIYAVNGGIRYSKSRSCPS